jgi:hypothetical protein
MLLAQADGENSKTLPIAATLTIVPLANCRSLSSEVRHCPPMGCAHRAWEDF